MTHNENVPSREGVAHLFDRIAPTYDLLNRLLSCRRDIAWRRELVAALPTDRPIELLDLATGTADVLIEARKRLPEESRVLGVDVSAQMLTQARAKLCELGMTESITLQQGNATDLAFNDAMFDVVTIAFGIRNVMDTPTALTEMLRVLKPGGCVQILEFSLPQNAVVRGCYLLFFRHLLPRIGGWISGDTAAYAYLNQTVETYPYGSAFVGMLEEAGFVDCACKSLTLGIASHYTGRKPI